MSVYRRIKSNIRNQQTGHGPKYGASYGGSEQDVVILPPKPMKRRKIMEVQKESKITLGNIKEGGNNPLQTVGCGGVPMDENDNEDGEGDDGGEKKKKPKKIPWGPPEILHHLKDRALLEDVNFIIANLKKTNEEPGGDDHKKEEKDKAGQPVEIVWDHSESKEGKKSDHNFFIWFESMAANEAAKVMAKENMIFE